MRLFTLFPVYILITSMLVACGSNGASSNNNGPSVNMQSLGKKLFFDENLSSNGNQSCASCHDPANGFADPDVTSTSPVSEGSLDNAFGNRNAPTSAYASFIPDFSSHNSTTDDGTTSQFQGGQFLDGRAIDLQAQAKAPFLNPVEMNNGSGATGRSNVVNKVQNATYANEFIQVFGATAFDDIDTAYENIALAIAAFETSAEMNPFSSKFDAVMEGNDSFTTAEENGFDLFKNKAKCANCHTVNDPPAGSLFTNFNYFNVGTPVNTDNPAYMVDNAFRDGGLGESPEITNPVQQVEQAGKFRTPTLRNIELSAPYMHNGRYQTLRQVINHYDIIVSSAESGFTPVQDYPEVDTNIAAELNFADPNLAPALGLSSEEMDDLEAFLLTLTDS